MIDRDKWREEAIKSWQKLVSDGSECIPNAGDYVFGYRKGKEDAYAESALLKKESLGELEIGIVMGGYLDENTKLMDRTELNSRISALQEEVLRLRALIK